MPVHYISLLCVEYCVLYYCFLLLSLFDLLAMIYVFWFRLAYVGSLTGELIASKQ